MNAPTNSKSSKLLPKPNSKPRKVRTSPIANDPVPYCFGSTKNPARRKRPNPTIPISAVIAICPFV